MSGTTVIWQCGQRVRFRKLSPSFPCLRLSSNAQQNGENSEKLKDTSESVVLAAHERPPAPRKEGPRRLFSGCFRAGTPCAERLRGFLGGYGARIGSRKCSVKGICGESRRTKSRVGSVQAGEATARPSGDARPHPGRRKPFRKSVGWYALRWSAPDSGHRDVTRPFQDHLGRWNSGWVNIAEARFRRGFEAWCREGGVEPPKAEARRILRARG
jgi:hypothetical protein